MRLICSHISRSHISSTLQEVLLYLCGSGTNSNRKKQIFTVLPNVWLFVNITHWMLSVYMQLQYWVLLWMSFRFIFNSLIHIFINKSRSIYFISIIQSLETFLRVSVIIGSQFVTRGEQVENQWTRENISPATMIQRSSASPKHQVPCFIWCMFYRRDLSQR